MLSLPTASGEVQLATGCDWSIYEFQTANHTTYTHNISATIESTPAGDVITPKVDLREGGECAVQGASPIYRLRCAPASGSIYEMALFLVAHTSSPSPQRSASSSTAFVPPSKTFDVAMALSDGFRVTRYVSSSDCTRHSDSFYTFGADCTHASFGFFGSDPSAPAPWPKLFNVSLGPTGELLHKSTDACVPVLQAPPAYLYQCNIFQVGLLFVPGSGAREWRLA